MKQSTRQRTLGFDAPEAPSQSHGENHDRSPVDVESNEDSKSPQQSNESAQPAPQIPTPTGVSGQTVWVVDAHALIYQVFHVMSEMTGPSGQPVGAIHGFTRDMLDLLEKKKPDYLICAFDHSDETFRNEIYTGYKQNRSAMPEDLKPQIPQIRRMLDALGIPSIAAPGYEADDVLATIARQTREGGGECFLVTNDKDCWQCVGDRVRLYNIRKDLVQDTEALAQQWGIRPDQVVDYQALVGDTVDEIPGVPLIGPKIAGELLRKYGSLNEILAHAEEMPAGKRRENLIRYREQALISRQLARLVDDVPLSFDWQAARTGRTDALAVDKLCREFGFRRLAERLGQMQLTVKGPEDSWSAKYHVADTPAALSTLVQELAKQSRVGISLETSSSLPRWAEIRGLAFSWQEGEAWYVPLASADSPDAPPAETIWEQLRPALENPALEKWGHDLKHSMVVLRTHGITLRGIGFDTMVADYLLAPGERAHDLDDLSRRYLQHEPFPVISPPSKKQTAQKQNGGPPAVPRADYEAQRADLPLRLAAMLRGYLTGAELDRLYYDVELPLIAVLAEMEFHGIRVDASCLQILSVRFGEQLQAMQAEIYELAGETFNIDSPKQIGQILFGKMNLPVIKRTPAHEPSTDAEVLEELALQHALPAKIVAYRQIAKLKGTYVDALPALIHPQTQRVHTSFKQDIAATGRLSSKDPNLQNIPVSERGGNEIRAAFLPQDGWQLLAADYSQIELRILAHFSRDAALLDSFARDEDIHTRVASEVFKLPLDQVVPEMRRRAKAVNFGIIYGQTAFGLAKALGIPQEDAATFIEAYFATYPGVHEFIEKTLEECRQKGYVSTILGRQRTVEGVRSRDKRRDPRFRTVSERIAVNTVIQGSAADLIKLAMINIHRRFEQERWQARMLLQIHDELVFEVPSDEQAQLSRLVVDEMSSATPLDVPLKVDVKRGVTWAECDRV